MKNIIFNRKTTVSILVVMLVICALPSTSYGSSDDISVAASTASPLTEATLHESVVTLTLSGGAYERSGFTIRDAVEVSGIEGVTVGTFNVDRVSDTEVTVELEFDGNIDTDATLTFTVGADAIAEYSGSPLTVQIPVTAVTESVVASTDSSLTEATLHESVVTLILSGRTYARIGDIRDAVEVSGIEGVTVETFNVDRVSDTVVTVELEFDGNIDTDANLTFTIGADAIAEYSGSPLTVQIPVTAVTESVVASTDSSLTEATLHESVVTLILSGGTYARIGDIRDAVEVSGIEGVTVETFNVDRVSDTVVTIELEFDGNIDTDATLTFTVGADAIANYNGPSLIAQIPVTATIEAEGPVTEDGEPDGGQPPEQPEQPEEPGNEGVTPTLSISTDSSLTEATLHESVVTLTLSGGAYDNNWNYISRSVTVSGIAGVTMSRFDIERISDTEITVELEFDGNIDTGATLTFTVGADAIAEYNGSPLTAQILVTADTEVADDTGVTPPVTGDSGDHQPEQPEQPDEPGGEGVTPTLSISTDSSLTEATLHESVITLTLSRGTYERSSSKIRDAMEVSGIEGVTVGTFGVERASDMKITVELEFDGNIDTDATLTFTVGAGAIAEYNGSPLTAQIPVTADTETVVASTEAPLTEATLDGSEVTLTLSGRTYEPFMSNITGAVTVSGIDGVTTDFITRDSDTQLTVHLEFDGNIDTGATLTFTVAADAIVGYNGPALITAQIPVTAITESVAAFTVSPLTTATLHRSEVTLILSGRTYELSRSSIRDAMEVSGIEGVTVDRIRRVSDTEITIELEFDGSVDGNIDTDVALTFTVGADAIAGYNGPALTATPVLTASVVASTASPLTEATLHESVVTLTLSDGSYEQSVSDIRDALMVSGMDGVTFDVERVSDTEITIELEFDGNIDGNVDTDATLTFTVGATRDIDAMLTFTVGANAIANYNGPTLTAQTPVTVNVPDTTTTGYGLSVAFSSYGILLASASEDNTVRLWDVETNTNIATLEGHERRVNAVAFSPDGRMLASAGGDGTVRLWNVESGQQKAALKGHEWVTSVAFSPDGTLLASGGDGTVRLWNVETNANIASLEGHTEVVNAVAFSPDGTLLASGSWDNTVKLWDVETNTNIATLEGHTNGVVSIAFSPNGTRLASASVDNTVRLWDVETNTNIASLEGHTDRVWSVTFSPDGTLLASAGRDATVRLWDVETNTNIATLEGHMDGVVSVAFSPNGTLLASASADNTVKLWDVVKWWTGGQPRPQTLIKVSGDDQEGMSGETLPNSLIVEVRDKDNNPLSGVGVTFTVTSGYGKLSEQSTIEYATTDANGQAEVTLTLGPFPGTNTVEVSLGLRTLATFNAVGVGMPTARSMEGDYRTWRLPDDAIMRLGKGAIGRGDRVVAFSPDSTRLAVASAIGIWLYDVATATEVALLEGHTGGVTSVAFSSDGTMLASGSEDETVKLWAVATHTNIATLRGHTDGVWSVVFSPDGKMLASGSGDPIIHFPADNTIKLWDVETNTNIASLEGHRGRVASMAFSPDGKILASGSEDETVKLWDVETNTNIATLEGHTDKVSSVAFSPDGKILASGGGLFDRTVKLWDVETNTNTATLEGHTDGVSSVAFSPDGKILASGVGDAFFPEFFPESSDNRVKLWDVASGEPIASLGGHTGEVWSVTFSPDGTMLASAGGTFDNTVKLWDVDSTEPIDSFEGHMDVVSSVAFLSDGIRLAARSGYSSVAFSPDGTRLATGSDNAILLWDVDSGELITTLGGHTLSPDGTRIAAVSEDGKILVWDVDSGELIATLEGHAGEAEGTGAISVLVFSPDGTRLAAGSGLFGDYAILVWDVDSGEQTATLEGHTGGPWGAISALAFSPDGTRLASASFDTESFDGTMLLVWDVDSGELIATLVEGRRLGGQWGEVSVLMFSPDGTRLAAGSGNIILLWDVDSGDQIATLEGHADYWVNSVSFAPNGATLASGTGNTILLWDVDSGDQITTLEGHADWVNSVSFAPNGATLASGAGDGTILLWDVAEWTNSDTTVAANKLIGLPNELQLQQNAPNPFNSQTVISYVLPKSGPVRLEVFSVIGQRVAVLRQGPQQAGYHRLHWNARDSAGRPLASGIYLYRLVTEEGILTHKLTLLR